MKNIDVYKIMNRLSQGSSLEEISKALNFSVLDIEKAVDKQTKLRGKAIFENNRKPIKDEDLPISEILNAYIGGENYKTISRRFRISTNRLSDILKRNDILPRKFKKGSFTESERK